MPTNEQIVDAARTLAAYVHQPSDAELAAALRSFARYVWQPTCQGASAAPGETTSCQHPPSPSAPALDPGDL